MANILEIIQNFNTKLALKNIYSKIDEIIRKVNKIPDVNYKKYVALLTQSGVNPPIATILENTFDEEFVWQYNITGYYYASNSLFLQSKTSVMINQSSILNSGIGGFITASTAASNDTVIINVYDPYNSFANVDGFLVNTLIEIRVYN